MQEPALESFEDCHPQQGLLPLDSGAFLPSFRKPSWVGKELEQRLSPFWLIHEAKGWELSPPACPKYLLL